MMRVGYYQFAPRFGKVSENLERVASALNGASADIIVLPELAFTGYSFRDRAELAFLAEDPAESPTLEKLGQLCRNNGFFLVTGFAEKSGTRIFNSALLIGPDGLASTYRKLHLFDSEKACFDPGDRHPEPVEIPGATIGMMVCFDWAFPEVARSLAIQGTDLLCHPSNLVLTWCQQAMLTRCLENAVFAVTANRHGTEVRARGSLSFTGQSQIAGPKGQLIHRAGAGSDQLYVAEIDIRLARNKSITPANDLLGDRRPEFYTAITGSPESREKTQ